MKRFAKTIVKVLIGYTDIVKKDFSNYVKDEKKVGKRQSAHPHSTNHRVSLFSNRRAFS